MSKNTAFQLIFLPILLGVSYAIIETKILTSYQRMFELPPVWLFLGIKIIFQGIILIIMYRSLIHRKERNYRILLAVMSFVSVTLLYLATLQIISFTLYPTFIILVTLYISALLYSLISKD